MKKMIRVISCATLLLMAFSLFACVIPETVHGATCGCAECKEAEFTEYKAAAKAALESHAEAKGQDSYSAESWAVISGLVTDGIAAIDAAADEAGVDTAVTAVKEAVDGVLTIQEEDDLNKIDFVIDPEVMIVGDFDFTKEYSLKKLVNSQEEWLKELDGTDRYYSMKAVEKYDGQFFITHAIIIYAYLNGTKDTRRTITGIRKNGEELLVEVDVRFGYMDAISQGGRIMEVKKSDIEGVRTLRFIETSV